jgi:hypothetical protein
MLFTDDEAVRISVNLGYMGGIVFTDVIAANLILIDEQQHHDRIITLMNELDIYSEKINTVSDRVFVEGVDSIKLNPRAAIKNYKCQANTKLEELAILTNIPINYNRFKSIGNSIVRLP